MTYEPPKVWQNTQSGGKFASINRPVSGPTHDKDLPVGEHPYQLYSLATPNGVKVTILFEELIEAGHPVEYDAWLIDIGEGDQFSSGFVDVNPNSKIPALFDRTDGANARIFESGAILMHLAERYAAFLGSNRPEMLSWLFWQMGSAPFLGGGFGHFYAYAPEKLEYPINRYAMEAKRQLHVLDERLGEVPWVAGDDYTIADMAIWPWYGQLCLGRLYGAAEFLAVQEYPNVMEWAERIDARPAVRRGRMVNRNFGDDESLKLPERHSRDDFK
ncbi:glutathione-dependent disulfide-bond oxidoreductase [Jannaschia formosa]|uniref:glutathione-dependent disulfide-bond oxidoreductase n=1 Tax=Jannaschia formosa TaxID=2259592 RepID=UPI000E1C2F5C|nr:glutathione-dependent disulfide-bond oxidoreductase [Jannaschia formosa]TFL18769.1 glutathione-dependent disulfide-bond oxidoreductase [Jannaschia formosa]